MPSPSSFSVVPDVPEGHDWSYVSIALADGMREIKHDSSESTMSGDTICDLGFVVLIHETLPLYTVLLELDPCNSILTAMKEWIISNIERDDYGYRPMHAVYASDPTLLEMYKRMGERWMNGQLGLCGSDFSTLEQFHTYLDAGNFEMRVTNLLRFINFPNADQRFSEICGLVKTAMREDI